MDDQIICPHCKHKIPLTEALSHQIKEKYKEFYKRRLEEEKMKAKKEVRAEIVKEVEKEMALRLKDKGNEVEELKKQNKLLQNQQLELNRLIRQIRSEKERLKLESSKKLLEDEEKIRKEITGKIQEENELKFKEYEKKLADARRQAEIFKAKIEQGSQQSQGEVLELELEGLLKQEFPLDHVVEIKKGQRGGDVLQEVVNRRGRVSGKILWELKNAKWSERWIGKLKEDQRQAKAHLAVLVVANPPEDIKTFIFRNGVWIVTRKLAIPLAMVLRHNLIRLSYEKMTQTGKNEKKEILYQYITSIDFTQRIEAIVEAFGNLQVEIEKEKRSYQAKWARQEKQLRHVIDHTFGVYGDLQGVLGKSLPNIEELDALPSGEEEK